MEEERFRVVLMPDRVRRLPGRAGPDDWIEIRSRRMDTAPVRLIARDGDAGNGLPRPRKSSVKFVPSVLKD